MNGDPRVSRASSSGGTSNKSVTTWRIIASTLACFVVVLAGLNVWKYGFSNPSSSAADEGNNSSDEQTILDSNELQGPSSDRLTKLTDLASDTDGPWVSANQQDFNYTISGKVADQGAKDLIDASVEETYGAAGISQIEVDPEVGTAGWVGGFPELLKEGAAQFIDGGFAANSEQLYFEGTFPGAENADNLKQKAEEFDFAIVTTEPEIVDLKPPSVKATVVDQKVTLDGFVPTQELITDIEVVSTELFGSGNVTNNLTVDENTYARFAFSRWGDNLRTFQAFNDFTLEISNEQFSSEVAGGVVFESGSSILSTEGETLLEGFPALLSRSNGSVRIIGHTDNKGDPATNLQLSSDRADAVKTFLTSNEVDSSLIDTVPKGETDPIASNDTEEGQRQNRRVEIVIIPLT